MRLRLSYLRPGEAGVDIVVTAEPSSTVGELASAIAAADPRGTATTAAVPTLRMHEGGTSRLLPPGSRLDDASIGSGDAISLASASELPPPASRPAAAVLDVLSGVDVGRRHELAFGSTALGRDPSGGVVLSDALVSKLHLRVNVADVVEVIDAGSANGTLVNGQPVERAVLAPGDVVSVGDSTLRIVAFAQNAGVELGGSVLFNRSPRLDPDYEGGELEAPEPPERPRGQRLPYLAVAAPLLMGGVLMILNPANPLGSVFLLLSPLLLVGTFVDAMFTRRRERKRALADFDDALAALRERIDALHVAELAGRRSESPSVEEVVASARDRGALLWTRRPEHERFLSVRLGTGTVASRHSLKPPGGRKGPVELWTKLDELTVHAALLEAAPVPESLALAGSIGVGGALAGSRPVARGVVAQLAALHSPAELSIVAVVGAVAAAEWDWLKWLPHVDSAFGPVAAHGLAHDGPSAAALLAELERVVDERSGADDESVPLPRLLVVVEDDAPLDRPRIVRIAESGPAVGVHLLWVAPSAARIPAACRTFVDLGEHGSPLVGFVRSGDGVRPVSCEGLDPEASLEFARSLAPVSDAGARADDASDLPRTVSLLALLGAELGSRPDAVVERWRQTGSILSGPYAHHGGAMRSSLRAVFGQGAAEPFALDLRADGPHALVGGTTGSGKSEFLQSWVLALAATHSPQRVTFLFVDYKGGAAFADCIDLPHTVGLVTDLGPHLVRRALTSLRAELLFREHLFTRKKVKDLVEFERLGDPEVPPSLVIVVDEFAALATEVPEFVDGVVDVAQRGRSLGLHLILATQRPAGVIRDNLRANTPLRIALRMADEADSEDVLGSTMAAGFDPALPGRAAAKTGPGRLRVFQSGYAGGWTTDEPERPEIRIETLGFGRPTTWDPPVDASRPDDGGPNDLQRAVSSIRGAAALAELPAPRKPWLPELASAYDLARLPNRRTDAELVLGVVDDAAAQSQPVVSYFPDRDGNVAVIGTGGSGKSTALRTVAVSAAVTARGGPVQIYGLDFAGGSLRMLEGLPHVGAIVPGEDEERVARLLRRIRDTVVDRSSRFATARAGDIAEYRKLAGRPDEPRILLLLDGMGAFREAFEASSFSPAFAVFSQIATDGRQVGVHVVVTGDRAGAIPLSLSSSIQRRLVLRLPQPDDYTMLGVEADVLGPASPPGRGVLDGREVQLAVLGGDGNVAVQAREIEALADSMRRAGVPQAPPVESLGNDIPFGALPPLPDGAVPIGIADDDLGPVGIDPTGALVVAGPPGSGRTTALATLARSLAATRPGTQLFLLSGRRSELARVVQWTASADAPAAVSMLVERLSGLAADGLPQQGVAVFLEHLADLADGGDEYELERVVKQVLKAGAFVVAESETAGWRGAYTVGQPLRAARRGILLQPDDGDGDALLSTPLGRIRHGAIPPGGGFLVERGRARRIQLARSD